MALAAWFMQMMTVDYFMKKYEVNKIDALKVRAHGRRMGPRLIEDD